jgi:hypothetical protein
MEILWKVFSAIDQMVSKAKIYSEIYSLVDIILIQGRQYNHDIIMGCTLYLYSTFVQSTVKRCSSP